tara:strand:+ start:64 stop:300 length:237 start_codon:yes stop_codon:yes gene_type:complete
MADKEKLLKTISEMLEAGILSVNDIKKELITSFQFKKDNIIHQMDLVTREEFDILKKMVQDQDEKINKLKKVKKAKKS